MMSVGDHIPVMVDEVVHLLRPQPGGTVVDATVGLGGHAAQIAARLVPGGWLIGIDRDSQALEVAARRLEPFSGAIRVTLLHADFRHLSQLLTERGVARVDGILFDLGVSSMQLDTAERGFSFRFDAPLDMRMDPTSTRLTAAEIVNRWSETELSRLIEQYGEEPSAGRIARAIVQNRPLWSTRQLAEVVASAVGRRHSRIHPATRTFQALRIAVNSELEGLQEAIERAIESLSPGGRIVVLTYHSLEARLVKRAFQRMSGKCICEMGELTCRCGARRLVRLLTSHALKPTWQEVSHNPRARSAQCRAAERLEA